MKEILSLSKDKINAVCKEIVEPIKKEISVDVNEIILYGSCARGNFNDNSDIDIAIILDCEREYVENFNEKFAQISALMDMKYFVVVHIIALPINDFYNKMSWYSLYKNIREEGVVIG